jgi:hypothetical protein
MENTQRTSRVFSNYAKKHKSVHISVNKNKNFKILLILSIYTLWDGLSLKTIALYCSFKQLFFSN